MLRLSLAISMLALSIGSANAMRMMKQDFVCPVDQKPFTEYLPISGYAVSSMLDFQQNGMIASPQPLAVCPGNGFVMFKQDFSADEIAKIRSLVQSPEFQAIRSRNNPWLLAVWEMKQLGQSQRDIASMYLAASWVAFGSDYNDIVGEAYAFVEEMNDPRDALILGEWERRLGRFEDAQKRFANLDPKARAAFLASGWTEERLQAYVDQQLALIAAKQSQSETFVVG